MLVHLGACADCRRAATAHDPSILFGLLALAPVPQPLLRDLSIEVARLAGSDRSPYGTLAMGAVWPRRAAAAAVILLSIVSGYVTLRDRPAAPKATSLSMPRADVDVDAARGVSQVIDLTVGETQLVMVYNGDLN